MLQDVWNKIKDLLALPKNGLLERRIVVLKTQNKNLVHEVAELMHQRRELLKRIDYLKELSNE